MEGVPQEQPPSYRNRMIGEVEGYISLFSGSNIFSERLDKLGLKEDALESYRQELAELYALPEDAGDEEARAMHDSYEEQRIQLTRPNT